jgi:hypothetical protein
MGGWNRWWAAAGAVVVVAFGCGDMVPDDPRGSEAGAARAAFTRTPAGPDIYVDQASTVTPADGSASAPYTTIGAAVAAAPSDAIIHVGPGVYAESLTISKLLTIQGSPGLHTRIENGSAWVINYMSGGTTEIILRDLHFVGPSTGGTTHGIFAYTPVHVIECQFERYTWGIRAIGVEHGVRVLRSRLVRAPIWVDGSGATRWNYIENSVVVGHGSGAGVGALYSRNSRIRAYSNLLASAYAGIYQYQDTPAAGSSEIANNLLLNSQYGIMGYNLAAGDLEIVANAAAVAVAATSGTVPGDTQAPLATDCGVSISDGVPLSHNHQPAGSCVNAGVYSMDPDGSLPDIGPFGGSEARCNAGEWSCADPDEDGVGEEPWWVSFPCRDGDADDPAVDPTTSPQPAAAGVSCPHHDVQQLLAAYPAVRHSLRFHVQGMDWPRYVDWPMALRYDLFEALDTHWHGVAVELPPTPENQASESFLESNVGVFYKVEDARRHYMSLVQQSLRAELQPSIQVPWSITAYDDEMLEPLFDWWTVSKEVRCWFPDGTWQIVSPTSTSLPTNCTLTLRISIGAVPATGPFVFAFLEQEGLVDVTPMATIGRLLEWSRTHMRHALGTAVSSWPSTYWWDYSIMPVERVITGTDPAQHLFAHWTSGCHGTNFFLQSVLRAVNVPVKWKTGSPNHGHATPQFMLLDEYLFRDDHYMSHGDDPYTMIDGHVVGELMLIDEATYNGWGVGTDGLQVGRRMKQLDALYMFSKVIRTKRCRDAVPNGETGNVLALLTPAYTQAELDAAAPPVEFDPPGRWTQADPRNFWESLDDLLRDEGCASDPSCLGKGVGEQGGACDALCRFATGLWRVECGCVEPDSTLNHALCNDGKECTVNTCDQSSGCQTTNVANGTACEGGTGECEDGACVPLP